MHFDNIDDLKDKLRDIATECVSKGPGYAQEGVVLREARSILRPQTLEEQQRILEAWHRLFIDGELGWGFDLDNPGAPFFHCATQRAPTASGVS